MIAFAFDFNAKKQDGSFEYSVHGENNRLPKSRVILIYDTNTGNGPEKYYVSGIQQQAGTNIYIHKLSPLPVAAQIAE